jgi:flagellar basal-body rod protein FlgF
MSMHNALVVGVSRQVALRRAMDVVANNVANLTTNGFRAARPGFTEAVQERARAEAPDAAGRRVSATTAVPAALDLAPGTVERTGGALDVAIRGEGFLVVGTARGERFTRDGAFSIDPRGRLVTSGGEPVLGDGGPIEVGADPGPIEIAADGTVTTREGPVGRLRLVAFEDPGTLTPEGGNLLVAAEAPRPVAAPAFEVGAIERSNVSQVVEAARLVEISRAYASVAGALSQIEEASRTMIERLSAAA